MRVRSILQWLAAAAFFLTFSVLGHAQNESVHGQVADGTGKAIPRATVKAVNNATGETAQVQSDKDGLYTIPLRTGNFTVTSTVAGFGNASSVVDIAVGASPELDFKMIPGGANAQVAVSGQVNQNAVTQQQVENLPSNGRNQIDLTLQAPRSDENSIVNDVFVAYGSSIGGNSQIIMDGQQVTTIIAQGMGQPKFSKDAVEQLQMGDRFDATQGRSSKLIVNEVYKSGTNQFIGRASGYFRSDIFNSPDYLTINSVTGNYETLPYSDQQLSFTFGGPIIKDRLHFFGNYEYERNPTSYPYASPWNGQTVNGQTFDNVSVLNIVNTVSHTVPSMGGRVDWQLRGQNHMMFRYNHATDSSPVNWPSYSSTTTEPGAPETVDKTFSDYYAAYTQVLSSKTVNVIRGGFVHYGWSEGEGLGVVNPFSGYSGWNGYPATQFAGVGAPTLTFTVSNAPAGCPAAAVCGATSGTVVSGNSSPATGFKFGQGHAGSPEWVSESTWTIRDDYSHTFDWHGGHNLKTGAEWLRKNGGELFQGNTGGSVSLTIPWALGPILPRFFTSQDCACTIAGNNPAYPGTEGQGIYNIANWNLGPLSQYATTISKSIYGPSPTYWMLREYYAAWVQDDWRWNPKLTVSLGVRYDIANNMFSEAEATPGIFNSGRPIPKNGFGPRVGFTYKLTNTTILRGGFGKYFADVGMQTGGNAGARENSWYVAAQEQYFATAASNLPGQAAAGGPGFNGAPSNAPTLVTLLQQAPQLEGYTSTPLPGATGGATVPAPGSILANYCVNNNVSGSFSISATGNTGCVRPALGTPGGLGGLSWSDNANIGVEKLFGKGWILNSDFYFEGLRNGTGSAASNMLWNPDGTNAPFNAYSGGVVQANNALAAVDRPFPNFGTLSFAMPNTLSNYLGFTNTLIKRAGPVTGTVTWTWSELRDAIESTYGTPVGTVLPSGGTTNGIGLLPFKVAEGYEGLNYYSYATTDQRNRVNINFLVKLSHGLSLSGLYFFGSGQALGESYSFPGGNGIEDDGGSGSGDVMPFKSGTFNYAVNTLPCNAGLVVINGTTRTDGGVSPCQPGSVAAGKPAGLVESTLCAGGSTASSVPGNTTENPGFNAGCLMVRDAFHPKPIDRVDARLTKTFKMGERVNTDIFAECFNLLNHENFGTWNSSPSSAAGAGAFGLPTFNLSLPFQARMAQFGFKVDFKL